MIDPSTNCTHTLKLRLPADLLSACQEHAECRRESLSEFVRRAMAETRGRDRALQRVAEAREAFRGCVFLDMSEGD